MKISPKSLILVAGAAMTLASAAHGQQLINVSGASLLGSFIRSQASVNDYIGVTTQTPAPGTRITDWTTATGTGAVGPWSVCYRVSGSLNGFDELVQYGYPQFSVVADNRTIGNTTVLNSLLITDGYYNNAGYILAGVTQGSYNSANTGGAPRVGTALGNAAIVASGGGVTIDVAYVDVPAVYGLVSGSAINANPLLKPTQNGFGYNPRLSVSTTGAPSGPNAGLSNALGTLGARNLADFPGRNVLTEPYDANTIFEYPLTLSPVAPIANPGTGITQMKMSDIRFTWSTGRTPSGENLMVATRDIGSGTRNAFNNHTGLDPSFGIGDNVGALSTLSSQDQLGPTFQSTNKGATSAMLRTVRYHRLAVGYAGAETARGTSPNGFCVDQSANIIDTFNDVYYTPVELATLFPSGPSATDFKRPTIANVLKNDRTGWVITGQAVIATIGDPKSELPNANTLPSGNQGGELANQANPEMNNKAAAYYVNNILRSIKDFNATTPPVALIATPAEFLASNFTLQSAAENLAPINDPTARTPQVPSAFANSFALANSTFANSVFSTPNTGTFVGLAPRRFVLTSGTYSDLRGTAALNTYITQGGGLVSYEGNPTQNSELVMNRNKIAYDFNGDGARTLGDARDMVLAWAQRQSNNTGTPWVAPTGTAGNGLNACIEILGDGNGDGSYTSADLRYWADGLAMTGTAPNRIVNRKAGFKAVDDAFSGATVNGDGTTSPAIPASANFFGTVKATNDSPHTGCVAWKNGDARADIAGPSGNVAPGWAPVGSDGRIDGKDIDYIYAQMRAVDITAPWTSGQGADWNDIAQAAKFDLSADMTGDLLVNKSDVEEVLTILGTRMGDVNLDGVVSTADRNIIIANNSLVNQGWAGGDLNGDGVVNAADLVLVCPADFDGANGLQIADIFAFLNSWFAGECKADFNGSGLAVADIFDFLNAWFAGC